MLLIHSCTIKPKSTTHFQYYEDISQTIANEVQILDPQLEKVTNELYAPCSWMGGCSSNIKSSRSSSSTSDIRITSEQSE